MTLQPKKTKHQLKREELIRQVKQLSRDCDLSELSVRELCSRMHFSTGSFYHYFKDKNEILASIFATVDEHLLEVEQQRFGPSQTQNILLVAQEYAQYNVDSGVNLIIHLNDRGLAGKGDLYLHQRRPIFLILQRCFAAGLQSGEFNATQSAQALAQMTLVVMRGYAFDWAKYGGAYDLVEWMTGCVALLLKSIA